MKFQRGKDFNRAGRAFGPKLVSAQMYSQRDYSDAEESVDEMMMRLDKTLSA